MKLIREIAISLGQQVLEAIYMLLANWTRLRRTLPHRPSSHSNGSVTIQRAPGVDDGLNLRCIRRFSLIFVPADERGRGRVCYQGFSINATLSFRFMI